MSRKDKLRTFWSVLKVLYFLALVFFVCFLLLLFGATLGIEFLEDVRSNILKEHTEQAVWFLTIGYIIFLVPVVAVTIHTSMEQCKDVEAQALQMRDLERNCEAFNSKQTELSNKIVSSRVDLSDALYDINSTTANFEYLSENCMKRSVEVNNKLHKLAKKSKLSDYEETKKTWQRYDKAWDAVKPLIKISEE